ncbi:cytochrome P450 [Aspergillus stella-maris]|uniref:cytochrome P450 n=1 Tax=Aspergillus stella-maris TaxID=1810926 RepID=UPI003CCD0094
MVDCRSFTTFFNILGFNILIYKILGTFVFILLLRRFTSRPKAYKLFPVWATIEIAVAGFILQGDGWGKRLFSSIRRYSGSLFGITHAHQLLVDFPGLDRLMSRPLHTLTAEPAQYTIFTRVFGGIDSPQLKKKLELSWKDLLVPIERLFLNDAAAAAAVDKAGIPLQASRLVLFTSDHRQMQRWELSADVRYIEPSLSGESSRVEANLQSLIGDFGACMAIPLLYGRDFLEKNPFLLDDFWRFDNDLFPMLMIGLPPWTPVKMMKVGRTGRGRILAELETLHRNIEQVQNGQSPITDVDMSDVSDALFERNKVYQREGWTFPERAAGDFAVFWGQNANTHPMLFWLLTYVYATPGLVERVREEIASYITLSAGPKPEIASMDLNSLSTTCPLLKACMYETYRMVNEPTSIRYVARQITLTDGQYQHTLYPGTFISAPQSLINHDASIFENPSQFNPERFLETDSATGEMVARYGRLRPWGVGVAMCKGRTFAEKEIVACGAAILRLWNIEPVETGEDGDWKIPSMVPGTGVKRPVRDIRVAIQRARV